MAKIREIVSSLHDGKLSDDNATELNVHFRTVQKECRDATERSAYTAAFVDILNHGPDEAAARGASGPGKYDGAVALDYNAAYKDMRGKWDGTVARHGESVLHTERGYFLVATLDALKDQTSVGDINASLLQFRTFVHSSSVKSAKFPRHVYGALVRVLLSRPRGYDADVARMVLKAAEVSTLASHPAYQENAPHESFGSAWMQTEASLSALLAAARGGDRTQRPTYPAYAAGLLSECDAADKEALLEALQRDVTIGTGYKRAMAQQAALTEAHCSTAARLRRASAISPSTAV
jgi:hypothetical protein